MRLNSTGQRQGMVYRVRDSTLADYEQYEGKVVVNVYANKLEICISMQRRKNKNPGTQPGSLSTHYTFSSPTLGTFSSPASLLEATVREPIT
jgi:hypothetical protein